MIILLPNPKPNPRVMGSAHTPVSLNEILKRGGVLIFPPSHPVDVFVTYHWKIWPRHAVNVVRVDFLQFHSRGIITFSRQYGYPSNTLDCPYRALNIRKLTFNPENSPSLNWKGPKFPWLLPKRRVKKSRRKK